MNGIDLLYLVPFLLIGGALTGILAGLFGIGGGTLLVPLLYEVARHSAIPPEFQMQVAIGTSLAIIAPTALVSYLNHKKKGVGDDALLRAWRWPVLLGVVAGAMLASFMPSLFLKALFACICGFTALRLMFDPQGKWRLGTEMPRGLALKGHGLGIGFLSALLGLGGGIFSTLLMTLYNRPIHQAVATSAGIGVIVAAPGAVGYVISGWPHAQNFPLWCLGFVSLLAVLAIAPLSASFAPLGVKLAHRFSKRKLEMAFACYLLLIAGRFTVALILD
jgi:uncharacterized membrane protein YfcA